MAGVDKIKEKIQKDSEERVNKIIEDANRQAESIIEKARQKALEKAEQIKKKADSDSNEKKKISNSMVELEIRKDLLSTKQEVIEEVFKAVLSKLSSLDNKEYDQIIYDMLIASITSGEEEIVLSSEGSKKISKELVNRVNQYLVQKGMNGNVVLSQETSSISGGFILKSKGIEINNSFEALIRLNRDEIEPRVAAMLF